jgi:hypothetical protein
MNLLHPVCFLNVGEVDKIPQLLLIGMISAAFPPLVNLPF